MTINSRNKGATFERDIARELELLTGIRFHRNLEQSRAVDHCDLLADDPAWPFSLELKRYATGTGCKPEWREQSIRAAAKTGKMPCVVYKFDRRDIRVALQLQSIGRAFGLAWEEPGWVEISIRSLAYIAREIMAEKAA